ncbi:DUF2326 domain-containing protein [Psychromonas sp. psych-6C06]|uniref:DUF2326 domain-containing protein n=1 Tax=Psychromonas sp. psych-6C06 TaxID=2058089 RepID=UPI000C340453|nr:DUF2326 domain-containing protein [Psychromonas sp. psych-6C06]PKF62803.1 DUF2326 domain-containing protein [Psychromonas sp. psych-6C06]
MIKLSKVYSNKKNIFPDIEFKDGLNVIFASVSNHADNKSSHSLGKTTLIDIIEFCLLKQISKEHILKKNCFLDFEFFLEVQYSECCFVTIKRPVVGKISITSTSQKTRFSLSDSHNWDHPELAFKTAKEKLNSLICPKKAFELGFNYRNGLRYCFRKQTQYENTFKVNNSREGDASWAPYLASVIGINSRSVEEKYGANRRVESLKNAIKEVKNLPSDSGQSLEAEITQIEASVSRMRLELDKFDFKKSDENVSKELIDDVSEKISSMLSVIYSLDQKIYAIDKSLKAEFSFEMEKVLVLFEEVELYFPESLTKSYEDLIKINQEMSIGRKDRLVKTKRSILNEREGVKLTLARERKRQQELTSVLLQKDAFEKYKKLQSRLGVEDSRVAVLKERLAKIDLASELGDKLEEAVTDKGKVAKKLEVETKVRGNEKLTSAVTIFSELVDHILNFSAFFYTDTNKDGNIQFKIGLKDQTSVNEGFSYTRVLSAIFDATLLKLNYQDDFFRFCYHDGLLESLDDRLKLMLIEEWRDVSLSHGLQFIITVLDSDLPLKDDKKEYFQKDEIIRELHDRGTDGRLFKMPSF